MPVIQRMVEAVQKVIDSALGVNLLDMIIQIAATLILVLIVKHFFWSKITDFLQKRKTIMDNELESAKKENILAKELKEKNEAEYNELKIKSKGMLDSAKQKAEQERLRILAEAKNDADGILVRTKKEIEAEKIKAKAALQKEVVDLAAIMAEKIIKQEVDESKFQDLLVEDLEKCEKS